MLLDGGLKPRVLFVGRTRYRLPLAEGLARKWDALGARLDIRVLASGVGSDERFQLVGPRRLEGPRFYAELPFRVAGRLRDFRPDAVVTESPFEAFAVWLACRLTRSKAKLVVEVHGDWRASTRLYGWRLRALAGPVADRVARFAVRRADAHRAISQHTAGLLRALGCEPDAVFPTYSDLDAFSGPRTPLPRDREILFVGVLERYKNLTMLAEAWQQVAYAVPGARLRIVGDGTLARVAAELAAPARAGIGASARRRSPRRWTRLVWSSCRRRPKVSAASRSRRSCAAVRSSRRGSGASPSSCGTA
jgi:glycosyltransferase involved in cell wall biosynthesis